MLEPNKTHVVVSSGADEELKSKAQEISSDLIFDGNDVIQLRIKENNTYIDTIYDVGNVSVIFDNEVFIRKLQLLLITVSLDKVNGWVIYQHI